MITELKTETYMDRYDQYHAEIARLWNETANLPVLSVQHKEIMMRIDELRELAYQCLPDSPMPNKDSWGRYHGKLV